MWALIVNDLSDFAGESASPMARRGSAPGWLALGLGLLIWFCASDLPSSQHVSVDWREQQLYEATSVGIAAALVLGLGLWAARRGRPRWVGLAAVAVAGARVALSVVHLTRWW